ncbi:hypothetical protein V1509DRAFT_635754 [Lipomyces kononenkoae]
MEFRLIRSLADHVKALCLTRVSSSSSVAVALETVTKPAVIKVHASAIHPSDRLNAKGGFPYTTFPRILGRDFSGTVVDRTQDKIGDDVYGTRGTSLSITVDGAQAEYCLVPENAVARKPKSLSYIQAADVGVPFTTAFLCLQRARVQPEDTVLVLGATGAVGSAAVQISRAIGCKAVITASRNDGTDINLAKDVNLDTVTTLTDGLGVDVIVDTVGNISLMNASLARLAKKGRYTWIAAPRGGSTILSFDIMKAYREEHELIGCNSLSCSINEMADIMTKLQIWFDNGTIMSKSEQEYVVVKLEDAVDAYEKDASGKVIVISMDK